MPFRTAKTDVWQYDIVVGGDRLRGSTGTKDWAEAKAVEAQIRTEAKAGLARRGRYTISEALGTYYRDVAQHQSSARTTASQGKGLIAHFGGKAMMDELTQAQVLEFVAARRATAANGTVNRQLQLLGRAMRHMAKSYGAAMPAVDLKAAETKEPKERERELSLEEQRRLFKHLRPDLVPFVTFALMTGARIDTIARLKWDDVHLDRGEMRFHLKGDETMTFPINGELRALLSALPRSELPQYRRFVFTYVDQSTKKKERKRIIANGGGLNADFRAAVRSAGITDFRFHDLRHTFATRMLRQTQNLKLVSRLLGHKNLATTERYAHVLVDDMRSALDGFSALTGRASQKNPQTRRVTR